MVHTFRCEAGHEFEINDDGKPAQASTVVALSQTRKRYADGCDQYVMTPDGRGRNRCSRKVTETTA